MSAGDEEIEDDASWACWRCGGEGGWASCIEDCCPLEGEEDACDDPACWRVCDVCHGTSAGVVR